MKVVRQPTLIIAESYVFQEVKISDIRTVTVVPY